LDFVGLEALGADIDVFFAFRCDYLDALDIWLKKTVCGACNLSSGTAFFSGHTSTFNRITGNRFFTTYATYFRHHKSILEIKFLSIIKMKNRRIIVKIVIFIALFALLIVSWRVWLPIPGIFLSVKDNIQEADCIVPLRGDIYYRFNKAIELYNGGYTKRIVISVLPERSEDSQDHNDVILRIYGVDKVSPREFALMAFKYFGKDPKGIYFTDNEVTSTYEEAVTTKDLMLKKGLKSLILVTSGYHMRRALMIFNRVFRSSGIKIYNYTAGRELINSHRWWLKEDEVKMVIQEYLSIGHNFIYHFLLKEKRTSFDSF